jgi:hypothetical protein
MLRRVEGEEAAADEPRLILIQNFFTFLEERLGGGR